MAKKKHQPPTKIKYDKTHPIVSVRVDQELKKQLDEIREKSGKSVGDILREALKIQAPSVKAAYDRGFNMAKKEYGVWYKCRICGGDLLIHTDEEKKDAARYMREHGWRHSECLSKYGLS